MVLTGLNKQSSSALAEQILNEKFGPDVENAGDVIVLQYCTDDLKKSVPVFV